MHQIIVEVDQHGQATIRAEGFQAPTCSLKTAPFIKALGTPRTDTATADMYATNPVHQEAQQ